MFSLNYALKNLLQNNQQIWRGSDSSEKLLATEHQKTIIGITTGFEALDNILPWGGWPASGLVEVLVPRWGIGELQLLLPVLVAISQNKTRVSWISWIAPPFIPYAPAMVHAGADINQFVVLPKEVVKDQSLWAMEKILRNRSCGIAISWPEKIDDKAMRRLKLAAQEGKSLGFIFRDRPVLSSPAVLRISIAMEKQQMKVVILKAKGLAHQCHVLLNLPILNT